MNGLCTKITSYMEYGDVDKESYETDVANIYDAADADGKEAINSIFIALCGAPLSKLLFEDYQRSITDEEFTEITNQAFFDRRADIAAGVSNNKILSKPNDDES